jgi:FkbM family methyltransferase
MCADDSAFTVELMQELMRSMNNWYGPENWDPDNISDQYKSSLKSSVVSRFNRLLTGKAAIVPVDGATEDLIRNVSRIRDMLGGLSRTHGLLADEYSKATLVKVFAYRLMGHKKVKLPLSTNSYWPRRALARSLIKGRDSIKLKFYDFVLNHFDLREIGYPIELYTMAGGVSVIFIFKQYEYGKRKPAIKARAGGYVIDAGGGWGDTALYFASEVGEQGKVYTFEFTPENLEVLSRNIELNPQLAQRGEIVRKALWERSGETLTFSTNGPATSVVFDHRNGLESQQVTTVSIDDFVKERKLPRVDFIKMDIEGAELSALKGAEETIRAFRPELAISLYHKEEDFVDIPAYLDGLGVGYEFFLDHFTIYAGETVLFAAPKVG